MNEIIGHWFSIQALNLITTLLELVAINESKDGIEGTVND